MKKVGLVMLACLMSGCCIESRRVFERTRTVRSGNYVCYRPIKADPKDYSQYQYFKCSYRQGPWKGSAIYPGTRMALNAASLYSYSSAASGDYMMGFPTLCVYPIVLCSIPINFCIDTLVLPWDIYNAPVAPEGYIER